MLEPHIGLSNTKLATRTQAFVVLQVSTGGVSSEPCAQTISNPGTQIIPKKSSLMYATEHPRVARKPSIANVEACLESVKQNQQRRTQWA